MSGVIWEYELDKDWVRNYLDLHAKGWLGTDAELERIMWAIFEHVGGCMDDYVKSTAREFLREHSDDLGIPSHD